MKEKEKLEKILKENPDPSKWSKWLKVLVKILAIIIAALGGDVSNVSSLIF